MYLRINQHHIKAAREQDFIAAMIDYARAMLSGGFRCHRFDIVRDIDLNIAFTANGMVSTQVVTIVSSLLPISFGGRDEPQVQLTDFGVPPGAMIELSLLAGDSETKTLFVPVLTTQLPEYNGLTPTPTPEPTPEPTSTAVPTETETAVVPAEPTEEPAAQ
jgi:hypothetical protein